jgi:hypothetical protein
MGIALWVISSVAALVLARMAPWRRRRRCFGEIFVSLLAGLALGAVATALDFGGWNEPDWRAGVFVFLGAAAAIGTLRLTIAPPPSGDPS